jgi:ribosomal protein L24
MSQEAKVGDLVVFANGDLRGKSGVVCRPIGSTQPGQVLVLNDGLITGVRVSADEVDLANESSDGFAQLAYQIIKLGSHIIEQRLLVGVNPDS